MSHNRILYGLTEWMSDVGGVSKAIMFTLITVFGNLSFFSSKVEMMTHLYSKKGMYKETHDEPQIEDKNNCIHEEEGGSQDDSIHDFIDFTDIEVSRFTRI